MMGVALLPKPVTAQDWLLVEVRDIPAQCQQPLTCIDKGQLAIRNMLSVRRSDRNLLLDTLNRLAIIRGIPEDIVPPQSVMGAADMTPILQTLPMAETLAPLVNHPGVFFDSTDLDATAQTANFSLIVREALASAGVHLLTEQELEVTPGRPTLSVSFRPRTESAGCIIPFHVSMAISEETVLVRNPDIKMVNRVWSGIARENLANMNYTPLSSLLEVVDKFIQDWKTANP